MISENKYNQYGYKRSKDDIKGITIHNTNNYNMTAQDLFTWLNEGTNNNGCHFIVDSKEVVEVMPTDWAVYHTGKGNDYGNHNTIAIEIVSNLSVEEYLKGQDRAIALIKKLMKKYNIPVENVYFHNDFNKQTYCPATILDLYGNKKNFIQIFLGGAK